jgi:hypothetical protein
MATALTVVFAAAMLIAGAMAATDGRLVGCVSHETANETAYSCFGESGQLE